MSYELADGGMSTDYKIGDEFTHTERKGIWSLQEDDGSDMPFFSTPKCPRHCLAWSLLVKVKPNSIINQLRSTIQYLERTIEELES
jgi:hypothetical protein